MPESGDKKHVSAISLFSSPPPQSPGQRSLSLATALSPQVFLQRFLAENAPFVSRVGLLVPFLTASRSFLTLGRKIGCLHCGWFCGGAGRTH